MDRMNFLDNITKEQIEKGDFPLQQILDKSLYYPSCGFDGGVIRDCNTSGRDLNIKSFIYCDYATGEESFEGMKNSFLGYHVVGSRNVAQSELIPNGWSPSYPLNVRSEVYFRHRDAWKPFIRWTVYERDANRTEAHGPERFSLLYLGGEGVATYQALYWTNKISAKVLAIIQPGTGFGLNWTDFRAPGKPLHWVVNENASGKPDIIYYGGYGSGYDDFAWPGYRINRIIKAYYHRNGGTVTVWEKEPLD